MLHKKWKFSCNLVKQQSFCHILNKDQIKNFFYKSSSDWYAISECNIKSESLAAICGRVLLFVSWYLKLYIWNLLLLAKLVSFARCCTSRNFFRGYPILEPRSSVPSKMSAAYKAVVSEPPSTPSPSRYHYHKNCTFSLLESHYNDSSFIIIMSETFVPILCNMVFAYFCVSMSKLPVL